MPLLFRLLNVAAELAAKKVVYFVIPSEARNLSLICLISLREMKERFLASLSMTKFWMDFSAACEAATHKDYDNFFWRYPPLSRRVLAGSLNPAQQVMGLS
jgi:hypothetical protein